jgi:hypothetical protein
MGGSRRKDDEAAIAAAIQDVDLPNGWMQKLLELGPDLAYVLAALAYTGQISASQIRKARIGLPSLASAKWTELAPQFGLDTDLMMARFKFDSFSITPVLLPPSFHETIAEAAWHIKDVLQEQVSQEREEVRIRAFDTVCPTVEEYFHVLTLHQVPYPNCSIFPRSHY